MLRSGLAALALLAAAGFYRARGRPACLVCPPEDPMAPPGSERTTHLEGSTSPYLLQHAHNPVDWYPWGEEAWARARREDKPIFLSIGYAACHWCHVMAHESFEDAEIAAYLNEHFVSIKVDREQRPDLDAVYMRAVQALTGRGGWPLSVFLTPDLEPFYGGTYWPPRDRGGMPGFRRVLEAVRASWTERRERVEQAADEIAAHLRRPARGEGETADALDLDPLAAGAARWRDAFDATWGGFGAAPKFPPAEPIRALLRHFDRSGDTDSLHVATATLDRMAYGGLFDQLGGGFHRYSVDRAWIVPHFEKMLYDNALLARAYLEAYQVTGRPLYARVARETLDYLLREMADPAGGFSSAQDADTGDVEGLTYTWTPAEVRDVLGEEDARLALAYFDVTEDGDLEGRSVLHIPKPPEVFAKAEGLDVGALEARLLKIRERLFAARRARPQPATDDKVLADWNALAISALARGAGVLEEDRYREAAVRAADFILATLRTREGGLLHVWRDGTAETPAFLDDYAYFMSALLDLYEATFDPRWVTAARETADAMLQRFRDPAGGGFYTTEADRADLIARLKDVHDGATPAGSSVAAGALAHLAHRTGEDRYREEAEAALRALGPTARDVPTAMASCLVALDFFVGPVKEVAVVGPAEAAATRAMLQKVRRTFSPRTVLAWADPSTAAGAGDIVPLLADRPLVDGAPAAYVCQDRTCLAPVTNAEALGAALGR